MKARVKLKQELLHHIRADLARRHPFAAERVGFVTAGAAWAGDDVVLYCRDYIPVADEDYRRNQGVGAEIGPAAMRKALEAAYASTSALLHIHSHGGYGPPEFSSEDLSSAPTYVPGFFNTVSRLPHGILVLSNDSAAGLLWLAKGTKKPIAIAGFAAVGAHINKFGGECESA